ncbi:MAG: hypothetical protein U1E42_08600 [Rhodospirillales bacterium]
MMCAAIIALAVVAGPAARAFTIDEHDGKPDAAPGVADTSAGTSSLGVRATANPVRRSDLLDPTRDPNRLPPIPQGARLGAGEYGFGNNSRYGYDSYGRPR